MAMEVKGLGMPPREFAQPEWDGRALGAGTLLLYAEQGLGDTIQFMRYAPLAAARCGTLVVEYQPQLAGLLGSVAGAARIVARGESLPSFDAQLPLMSLPRVFDTTPDNVPWNGPYLRADARRVEPLARLEHVALYSLQWGEGRSQLTSLPPDMKVVDFGDRIREFGDMGALVACLDVVISVDSSVTHLAGALGVPARLLLAYAPDWRWLLERGSSPWYPSVRLFRQASDRRWEGVVRRVAAELA